jgi:EAL domain-containing protein (putative c-di-GMP-specific phosphodiesterase class I)
MVPPLDFISLAEETGLIVPLGKWVLEEACRQAGAWSRAFPTDPPRLMNVNISARQFQHKDLIGTVLEALRAADMAPGTLKLEITESMLLDNIDATIATMVALGESGVGFSLDDFGTGYSSLQYLKRLPLDQLKIDQSFVRDLATDSSDKAIVTTIIAMAHSLGLDVIAEGVETEEQRRFLLDTGCSHYQGYLFGKPLPIGQFEALLKKG